MTLAEFSDKHDIGAVRYRKNGIIVDDCRMRIVSSMRIRNHDIGWDLYHLTDYVVTSNEGGSIWLAPRV
jgi:hypothetical protein